MSVPPAQPSPDDAQVYRVTTLELFFDLVFVFAITQLTGILVGDLAAGGLVPLLRGLLQVLLAFGVLWWMYGGYAWLTNALTPSGALQRMLLIVGMAGFLIVALATPHAFTAAGVAWGLGYLIVVLVHGGLYLQANRNIMKVLPANVLAALLVIGAGLLEHGPAVYVLWTLALLIPILTPYFVPPGAGFPLQAAHIVERHGALVLITFGESIIAIGIGAAGPTLRASLVVAAVLALALVAALWWIYFAGDDERVEHSLTAADGPSRTAMIMHGYFYAHIPILIGVVTTAAGLKKAVAHAWEPLHTGPAIALAGGVALYLIGDVWFRHVMRIGPSRLRLGAAATVLATIPLGGWKAEAEVVALVAVLAGMLAAEHKASTGRPSQVTAHLRAGRIDG